MTLLGGWRRYSLPCGMQFSWQRTWVQIWLASIPTADAVVVDLTLLFELGGGLCHEHTWLGSQLGGGGLLLSRGVEVGGTLLC